MNFSDLLKNTNQIRFNLRSELCDLIFQPNQYQISGCLNKAKNLANENYEFLLQRMSPLRQRASLLAQAVNSDAESGTLKNEFTFGLDHGISLKQIELPIDANDATAILGAMLKTLDSIITLTSGEDTYLGKGDDQIQKNIECLEDIAVILHNSIASIYKHLKSETKLKIETIIDLSKNHFFQPKDLLLPKLTK